VPRDFWFRAPNRPPLRISGSRHSRPANGPSLASYNSPLPLAGAVPKVPPIPSPGGSVFGFARQTAPPCAFQVPGHSRLQLASLPHPTCPHHRFMVVICTSHRYRARGARFSVTRAKSLPTRAHRIPAPPALQTRSPPHPITPRYPQLRLYRRSHRYQTQVARFSVTRAKSLPTRAHRISAPPALQTRSLPHPTTPRYPQLGLYPSSHRYRAQAARSSVTRAKSPLTRAHRISAPLTLRARSPPHHIGLCHHQLVVPCPSRRY
jgi:hypothetical protein